MNTVLVTGAFGQLGTELQLLTAGKPGFLFTDIREEGPVQRLDICDSAAVERFVVQNNVGAIINCAAYTDVNRAESDRQRCYAINVEGPANLARSAHRHDAVLVQISTDYVFDGKRKSGIPYAESSRRHPLSVYGESKRACEDAARRIGCRGVILRTAWLYSPFGKNFVKTMLRLGSEKPEIGVVADQFGTPTYARDLAQAILALLPQIGDRRGEIYHYTDEGSCSWAEFAARIMQEAELPCRVNPLTTDQYPTPAARPAWSVLSKDKIRRDFDVATPHWETSLRDCLQRLKGNK
ncbi:MAG: dTDP-4-dehydrorhamnose reductase [Bacteroidales bacterium]|nr:dTDP-4-dehydrorhamnose reductase [Bacteroidales bacterium]MBR5018910.1 dTDP-4-dehydrorhamnose reductase [Bacteroidales bacterium]